MLRLTGKLAVTVGAGSVLITAPACGGGEGGATGVFSDCEFVRSVTYPYYYGDVIYNAFYCDADVPGEDCFESAYGYTCYETIFNYP
jgi:hypothetical protein